MGIKVNMTTKEGSSAALDPLPAGKYLVAVTDGSLKQSSSAKNPGKPFYNLELTVQEGTYEGRKIFTNVMCFEGALYSIAQMLKALGVEVTVVGDNASFQVPDHEENEIPELDFFMGQIFVVKLSVEKERTVEGKTYSERNEVKSWSSSKDWKGPGAAPSANNPTGKNPLLPA